MSTRLLERLKIGSLKNSFDLFLHIFMCSNMCKKEVIALPTNLVLDDKLIEEALVIGGHRTKKAVVSEALQEYI